MTGRDRIVVCVVLAVGVLGLSFMLVLNPKRKESAKLSAEVTTQRQHLDAARTQVTASRTAQQRFATDYATVARLGKAVPDDDNVPSLVYQLDSAANATGVDFRTIKLSQSAGASAPSVATTAPSSPSSGSPSSGSGTSGAQPGGSGSSPPAGGTFTAPTTGAAGSPSGSTAGATPGGTGTQTGGSSAPGSTASSTASATATAAPATQAAAATLPPGSTIGSAGFPTLPFSFTFEGSFFRLSDFLRKLDRFVVQRNDALAVSGRLLTIDGISLQAASGGFPMVKATIAATSYLVPSAQGLFGGATPQGPSSGSSPAPASSGSSAGGTSSGGSSSGTSSASSGRPTSVTAAATPASP